jgi:cellulose synthase/poly-beta-1,6-N-acetylglucosamine synthase-like glycosyltransferase
VFGFDKVKEFKLINLTSKTRFSVIIPFRNEAENLLTLLESIKSLNYPKNLFEIILVNDESEDNSINIIKEFLDTEFSKENFNKTNISLINNKRISNSPKKDAITKGINQAKHEWIITTDADCKLPKYWLDSFDEFIQQAKTTCIAAPVSYHYEHEFLNTFQVLDFLSLQGATIGGFGINKPFLCNGANFAYKKEVFIEVNGFENNTNIASGDDIFLLEKIAKKHPKQVHFLKCEQAIVTTSSQRSWKDLLAQRVRWAAKTSSYNNWFGKLTGLIVLLMNSLIIISILLTLLTLLKSKILFYILFIKFNIDVLLIYKATTFYNQKEILKSVLFAFIVYPFFSVSVAFISLFKGYKWKERPYKK